MKPFFQIIFIMALFASCVNSKKEVSNSEKETNSVKPISLEKEYAKLIIGAWEMDSLVIDGESHDNTHWVEVYNPDSTHCFYSSIKQGITCIYKRKGDWPVYGVTHDTLFEYSVNWEKRTISGVDWYKKIILLNDSIFVYKTLNLPIEKIHYYHRIK